MRHDLQVRRLLEDREESLSPYAQKSRLSRGRARHEPPSPVRTEFQRDRDRIIHCKSFRRLKHKTQVFIATAGDHYRTRLTHTLECSQIARTIARALNLNEDLAEAISLGHDLGHTPFGHVGEDVLNELYKPGFRHNEQSLRIVEKLENNGRGLNLTWEVRDGIARHSKSHAQVLSDDWGEVGTLEGEIVKLADIVAYINHDIDDALRAGIITADDLPSTAIRVLGDTHSRRIDTMVRDIINCSWAASGRIKPRPKSKITIGMSDGVREATAALRDFLFARVYNVQSARKESEKARLILRRLYRFFTSHPDRLPADYRLPGDDKSRSIIDYISGMTDRYAENTAAGLSLLDTKPAP
jgi:dGTPase